MARARLLQAIAQAAQVIPPTLGMHRMLHLLRHPHRHFGPCPEAAIRRWALQRLRQGRLLRGCEQLAVTGMLMPLVREHGHTRMVIPSHDRPDPR